MSQELRRVGAKGLFSQRSCTINALFTQQRKPDPKWEGGSGLPFFHLCSPPPPFEL